MMVRGPSSLLLWALLLVAVVMARRVAPQDLTPLGDDGTPLTQGLNLLPWEPVSRPRSPALDTEMRYEEDEEQQGNPQAADITHSSVRLPSDDGRVVRAPPAVHSRFHHSLAGRGWRAEVSGHQEAALQAGPGPALADPGGDGDMPAGGPAGAEEAEAELPSSAAFTGQNKAPPHQLLPRQDGLTSPLAPTPLGVADRSQTDPSPLPTSPSLPPPPLPGQPSAAGNANAGLRGPKHPAHTGFFFAGAASSMGWGAAGATSGAEADKESVVWQLGTPNTQIAREDTKAHAAAIQQVAESPDPPPAEDQHSDSRCPALFAGSSCSQPSVSLPRCLPLGVFSDPWLSVSQESWPHFMASRWGESMKASVQELADLRTSMPTRGINSGGRTRAFHRCAVVSSAHTMLGSRLGADIDAFDLVARVNGALVSGFETDVGSFTTLRYTNYENEGMRERMDEVVLASWCGTEKGRPACKLKDLRRIAWRKLHPVNPAFVMWTKNPYFKSRGMIPTSGFVLALLLAHMCQEVTLAGFSLHAGKTSDPKKLLAKGDSYKLKRWYYTANGGTGDPRRDAGIHAMRKQQADDYTYLKVHEADSGSYSARRLQQKDGAAIDMAPSEGTNASHTSRLASTRRWLKGSPKKKAKKDKGKSKTQSHGILLEKACLLDLARLGIFHVIEP